MISFVPTAILLSNLCFASLIPFMALPYSRCFPAHANLRLLSLFFDRASNAAQAQFSIGNVFRRCVQVEQEHPVPG